MLYQYSGRTLEELKESEEVAINNELNRLSLIGQESIDPEDQFSGDALYQRDTTSTSTKKAVEYEDSLLENKEMLLLILEKVSC